MKTMLDYINEIPQYIYSHLNDGSFNILKNDYLNENKKDIVIIASGSSNNASYCAYHYLKNQLKAKVNIYTPYSFYNYEDIDSNAFYIVISQSGRSINTLKVIDKFKENNIVTHFITDNKEIQNDELLKVYLLDVGDEEVPFVTKGMSSTIYFLLKFANSNFMNYEKFASLFESYQKKAKEYFEKNKELLTNVKRVHILGSGPSMYVSREGSLKFCETLHVGATPYEIEEFLHGGNFELQKDHLVIMINSNDCEIERINKLKDNLSILCDNYYVLDNTNEDESLSTIIYLAFFQTLVYLINKEKGNLIPMMEEKYLNFEEKLKAKTINYYK